MNPNNDHITSLHLILGLGVTGKALADFFTKKNWPFAIFDDNMADDPASDFFSKRATLQNGQLCVAGQLVSPQKVLGLFPSPGIPPQHPLILWCKNNGISSLSEMELASEFLEGKKFIGITGTNGKSTVVKLIHALLSDAKEQRPNG